MMRAWLQSCKLYQPFLQRSFKSIPASKLRRVQQIHAVVAQKRARVAAMAKPRVQGVVFGPLPCAVSENEVVL